MDFMEILSNARIMNAEGVDLGEVLSVTFLGGTELIIITDMDIEDGGGDDGDGKEDPGIISSLKLVAKSA